ncbi:MAG: hypothetical protein LUE23_12600 [Lachnospiraceae bacterium]|nr:hypothetical protein [Lachnospiraceae bacterium]MCD8125837.1 hypothetical protein [Lachnospiraceae bacterium]
MAGKGSWRDRIARRLPVNPRLDRQLLALRRSFLEAAEVLEQLDKKGGRRRK